MTVRKQVRIEGKVQGVWYRAWTETQAQALALTGWVRNRLDGSVEALFVGPLEQVEEMLKACLDGPPAAQVTAVTAVAETPTEGYGEGAEAAFVRLPTL